MKRYDRTIPRIVTRIAVNEEIIFQGKKIIREKIIKEFNMPKIINEDLTFQMQFGFHPGIASMNTNSSGIKEHFIDK
tara:strand:+ start:2610 stop:2840 length:231 start_codon:yes stop_codon:yes gene_type:complete